MRDQGPIPSPETTASDPQAALSATLLDLMIGSWKTQAISVAAALNIADLLEDGPRSLGDLACATETHPGTLYRLLRALAGIGLLAEDDSGRFALMPLAQGLRTKVPGSLRNYAVFLGSEG